MSIEVRCANGHWLKIKDEYAGKRGKCPVCGSFIRVPLTDTVLFNEDVAGTTLQSHESGVSIVCDPSDDENAPSGAHPNFGELVPANGGRFLQLTQRVVRVGRDQNCDVVLSFSTVSRVHAELRVTDRCWQVEDLGSTNGTKVNGDRVVKCRLHSGDTLSFGTQRYVIIYSQNALWSAEPDAPAAIARRAASQNHERTEQLPKVARE